MSRLKQHLAGGDVTPRAKQEPHLRADQVLPQVSGGKTGGRVPSRVTRGQRVPLGFRVLLSLPNGEMRRAVYLEAEVVV